MPSVLEKTAAACPMALLPAELDSVILTGPFQLEIFYDSMRAHVAGAIFGVRRSHRFPAGSHIQALLPL